MNTLKRILPNKNMQAKQAKPALKIVVSACLFAMLQLSNAAKAGEVIAPINSNSNTSNPVSGISDIYSDIDMRMRLANKASAAACTASQCEQNQNFDTRVGAMGRYLGKAAIQLYPQQEQLIQKMTFTVADKQEAGTASNNKGQIVVLRGVQDLQLSDDALGFVLAREMSHVLAGHHKTNTSTKLIISALASVLFPAIAIVGASSAAAQASTATTLLTSAASTATSMLGGEVAIAKMKPTQLSQADDMALAIMEKAEWDMRSAQSVLIKEELATSAWMLDLETSRIQLANKIEAEDVQITPLENDYDLDDNTDLLITHEQETQQNIELQQAVDAESAEQQGIQETILESNNINEAELDGVKITPLPANTETPFTHE
jgi:Peptidase family M48